MKESKSKCRRKRHEGEYDLPEEKRSGHHKEYSDRRIVEERRVIEGKHSRYGDYERRVVEERQMVDGRRVPEKLRSRPHPLDPLDDGRYHRYPSEDRYRAERPRHSSDDKRHSRVVSEDRRGRHENGSRYSEDRDKNSRLNGHHHHHHRKHKHREDSSGEPAHKKKKACRRKREKMKEEEDSKREHKERLKERSRSESLSPSPSSSSSSPPTPERQPEQPPPPPPPEPKPTKLENRDVAPATHLNLPPPPAEPSRPSYWDDDENKPARYRTNWGKQKDREGGENTEGEDKKPIENIAKPDFGLSGKLVEETNTYKGVVIKYSQPPEARMPKRRWRLYPFKGDQALPTLYIHRQSAYLIGRERKIVDIPVDHPSISKQHAVLQYRLVPYTRDDGSKGQRIRPYIIDLNSANGTFVNNQKIDPSKYVELLERDVVKFAFSSREYVLLHEHSSEGAQDDEAV